MLTSSIIVRYGIQHVFPQFSSFVDLFSGSMNDPEVDVNERVLKLGFHYWDITFAIGINYTVETQLIIFKDKQGYERYLRDGITLFDDKES